MQRVWPAGIAVTTLPVKSARTDRRGGQESGSLALVHPAAPLTVSLAEIDRGDVALAGGKGANLGDLVRAGFPVPDGFVLTTRAYSAAAEAAAVDPANPAE